MIRLVAAGTGAVHRQLKRLEEAGLVTVTRIGNQKHYQANPNSPLFDELRGLVDKTVGLAAPLREALAPLADRIDTAFIFGSVARGAETSSSDLDLMVISDVLTYPDLIEALQAAEQALGRRVNPVVMTLAAWKLRQDQGDSFAARVTQARRVFIIGDERAA